MARIKFKDFVPRPKPKKRPRRHAKSVSKRIPNKKKYRGQGRWRSTKIQILDYHSET